MSGSATGKVTPGFHDKSMVNINVCYQILIIWKMTRSGKPEIYHLNTAPRIPHQDIQAQGLPDEQAPPRPLLPGEPPDPFFLLPHTLHQGSAPAPTATAAQRALPSSPPTACGHLPNPSPEQGTPGWGGLPSNASTKNHPSKSRKPPGARAGPGPLGSDTGACHLNPRPRRGLALGGSSSRNALLRTLDPLGD